MLAYPAGLRSLNFGLRLHLNPNFVCACIEGSGGTEYPNTQTLLDNVCKLHARIQNFFQGGSRPDGRKIVWTTLFLSSTYFTVNRGGPIVLLQRKLCFSKDPERFQHFPGGPTFFRGGGGGPNANFYGNPYNLLFSRGVWTPYHPLWIRT